MKKTRSAIFELIRVYHYMAGRFEGLSDLEWKLFEDIFPPEPENVVKKCLMRRIVMY